MSEESQAERLEAYFTARRDRPLGDTESVSDTTRSPFSRAALAGADNLLTKADRAWAAGDSERARRFIERAAALTYDEHEQTSPAAHAAGMLLFETVSDALEDSPEDDARWLDAAVTALSAGAGWGRSELRHSLLAIVQDYDLVRTEQRAIRAAVAEVPDAAELIDTRLSESDLAAAVESVLGTLHAYRTALEESGWSSRD